MNTRQWRNRNKIKEFVMTSTGPGMTWLLPYKELHAAA
jgi:hypothetical protein